MSSSAASRTAWYAAMAACASAGKSCCSPTTAFRRCWISTACRRSRAGLALALFRPDPGVPGAEMAGFPEHLLVAPLPGANRGDEDPEQHEPENQGDEHEVD